MASESLFATLLGEKFAEMPAAIRQVHDGRDKLLLGKCTVQRGTGLLSRVFGGIASLPNAGDEQELSVTIACVAAGERWLRNFAGKKMSSGLTTERGLLIESLGPMQFAFALHYSATTQELHWVLRGVKVLGIGLPPAWFSSVSAREFYADGRYHFDVKASLPVVGLLVHYQGWLSDH